MSTAKVKNNMNILINIFNVPKRIINRIRREMLRKSFKGFGNNSGIIRPFEILNAENIIIGNDVRIGANCSISTYNNHFNYKHTPLMTIGDRSKITGKARITCAQKIVIEEDVLIASGVYITDHNHGMNPIDNVSYSYQSLQCKEVVIGKGVWIGERVCILPGAKIGEKSIIGANSVVTGEIPPYCIAVGIPARVIKKFDFDKKEWVRV